MQVELDEEKSKEQKDKETETKENTSKNSLVSIAAASYLSNGDEEMSSGVFSKSSVDSIDMLEDVLDDNDIQIGFKNKNLQSRKRTYVYVNDKNEENKNSQEEVEKEEVEKEKEDKDSPVSSSSSSSSSSKLKKRVLRNKVLDEEDDEDYLKDLHRLFKTSSSPFSSSSSSSLGSFYDSTLSSSSSSPSSSSSSSSSSKTTKNSNKTDKKNEKNKIMKDNSKKKDNDNNEKEEEEEEEEENEVNNSNDNVNEEDLNPDPEELNNSFPNNDNSHTNNGNMRREESEEDDNESEEEEEEDDDDDDDGYYFEPYRAINRKKKHFAANPEKLIESLKYQKIRSNLTLREYGFPMKHLKTNKMFRNSVVADEDLLRVMGLVHTHKEHRGCVNSLCFSQDGNLIVSGSDDLCYVIYDWVKRSTKSVNKSCHTSNIFQTKFMPFSNNSVIATSARDGSVRLVHLRTTGERVSDRILVSHLGPVHKLALKDSNSREFYSCGEDGMVAMLDTRKDTPTMRFHCLNQRRVYSLFSIHSNPVKGHEICVAGKDKYIRIYDIRKIHKTEERVKSVKSFFPEEEGLTRTEATCALYNYNGTEIVASFTNSKIYLFDSSHSDSSSQIADYKGHRNSNTIKGVNFYGPHSEYVVSGSDCGKVFIWNKKNKNIVNLFHADDCGGVNVIEPHPSLPLLATSGLGNEVNFWMPSNNPASQLEIIDSILKKNEKKVKRINSTGFSILELLHSLNRRRRDGQDVNDPNFFDDSSGDEFSYDDPVEEEEEEDGVTRLRSRRALQTCATS